MSLFEMKQCLMTKKEDNNLTKMPEGEMNFFLIRENMGVFKLFFGSDQSF